MKSFKLFSAIFLLGIINAAFTSSLITPQCWEFEDNLSGWTSSVWRNAPSNTPDLHEITDFPSDVTNYAWLQEQSSPPRADELTSPIVTINDGDSISATLYRHLVKDDGNDRINLTFVSGTHSKTLLRTANYDVFDTVIVTCSNTEVVCCESFPCDGIFIITGEIAVEDELVAVSHVGINCDTPPTPTPPPITTPPPVTTCCEFDTNNACDWSLIHEPDQWHWSGTQKPVVIPSPFPDYIWIENAQGTVASGLISHVTEGTKFSLTYYFITSFPAIDYANVYFGKVHLGEITANVGIQTLDYICPGYQCCDGMQSCSGQLRIEAFYGNLGSTLSLSIDRFCVYNAYMPMSENN